MLNLTERIEAIVYARAAEMVAGYGIVETGRDENGMMHFKGAVDRGKHKRRVKQKDGSTKVVEVKGASIEPDRVGFGYKTDAVEALVSELKAAGIRIAFDDAYGLLLEAKHQQSAYSLENRTKSARKSKDQERRDERKRNGLCQSCGKEPAIVKADGSTGASCSVCVQRATDYNKRKRARSVRTD